MGFIKVFISVRKGKQQGVHSLVQESEKCNTIPNCWDKFEIFRHKSLTDGSWQEIITY
jgi:hypothetical protein